MIIFEVCVFDKDLKRKKNFSISPECDKYLKQILGYLKGKIEYDKLFDITKDILFLLEDELTFLFTSALLFVDADKDTISKYTGVDSEVISLFEEIFFNLSKLKGKIAKIGFYKRLIASSDLKKQSLGVILKSAYTFGDEYIKWKFGLNELTINTANIIDNTFKDMYFKYMESSYKMSEDKIFEHIRTGKQIISAASDIAKATASGGSSIDDIKAYLMSLQEETAGENMVELEYVDIIDENSEEKDENG